MLSPVPAPTSVPSATRTPASRCRRSGNSPLPRNALLDGQWATAAPAAANRPQLGITDVDVVGEHRPRADKTEPLIRLQIVARPRELRRHELDLAERLVQMARHEHPGSQLRELPADRQQLIRAGQREPRADGVADQPPAVPPLQQVPARLERRRRRRVQLWQQAPVGHDKPTRDPQPGGRPRREQGLLGPGEVRSEHERGRRPVRRQTLERTERRPQPRTQESASRASSGSATDRSQSSSPSPSAPITRTCGKCTWQSTNPGSRTASRASTTSASGRQPRTSCHEPTPTIRPSANATAPSGKVSSRPQKRTDCGEYARPGPGRSWAW